MKNHPTIVKLSDGRRRRFDSLEAFYALAGSLSDDWAGAAAFYAQTHPEPRYGVALVSPTPDYIIAERDLTVPRTHA